MQIDRPDADEDGDRPADPALEAIAIAILDGAPVDWPKAPHDSDPALLRQLHVLSDLTALHRSLTPSSGSGSRPDDDLTPIDGMRWGPLTLRERIGRGAFGEVYRAWDPRLDREVALKLLRRRESQPDAVGSHVIDEGRLLARVRHPNVVTVHGADRIDGRVGLWMEFVRGRTLEAVLGDHGPFGAEEATLIGLDLSRALAAVHTGGLIHRDVKAQNVMREAGGRIVLMDFGTGHDALGDSSAAPAGTPLYLAPEVFRGATATARSDIYSVGVLLFHLVTRSYPVTGTIAEIREAHDQRRRSWLRDARPDLPETFVQAVERALEWDPKQRYQSAGAMEAALARVVSSVGPTTRDGSAATVASAGEGRSSRSLARAAWIAGAALALVTAITAVVLPDAWRNIVGVRQTMPAPAKIAFQLDTPWTPSPNHFALSPDGTRLVSVVSADGGHRLWLHAMDRLDGTILAGTEDARFPFWSADGRSIAFFADNNLKKVDVGGGPPQTIAEVGAGAGGTWNRDEVILFGGATGQLFRVPASGGTPAPVTALDPDRQEVSHRLPQFLPDGVHFLFLAVAARTEHSGIYVGSLDSTPPRRLLDGPVKAVFASSGHLLSIRDGTLVAQPFDPARLELAGDSFRLAENVSGNPSNGTAPFTVSSTGLLAYRSTSTNHTVLRWFNRSGRANGTLSERAFHGGVQLSHDGTQAAVPILDETRRTYDIWLYDVARRTRRQFTFGSADERTPVWSHDDRRIVFSSQRESPFFRMYLKNANGAGGEQLLLEHSGDVHASDWSRDGRSMLYVADRGTPTTTLWVLPFDGLRKPQEFIWSTAPRFPSWAYYSPDGRWVAYTSNESGRSEVYVVPSDGSAGKWRISRGEGAFPRWRRDGREIYYVQGMSVLMATAVDGQGAVFQVGDVSELFPIQAGALAARMYDVTPDGQRFLVNAFEGGQPPITVVVNWTLGLP